jgi:hypothetical protein
MVRVVSAGEPIDQTIELPNGLRLSHVVTADEWAVAAFIHEWCWPKLDQSQYRRPRCARQ